jgi:protein gp37
MPNKTSIEYVGYTSNPIYATFTDPATGKTKRGHHCVKISKGCVNCYAEAWNTFRGTGLDFSTQSTAKIQFAINVKELEALVSLDRRLQKKGETARCFLGDMTDIFQKDVPKHFLDMVFGYLGQLKALTVMIFTKRADRMAEYSIGRGFDKMP